MHYPGLRCTGFFERYNKYPKDKIDTVISQLPMLNEIHVECGQIPTGHFDYITELSIGRKDFHLQLNELTQLKNLKRLKYFMDIYDGYDKTLSSCFFSHEPTKLNSISNLNFDASGGPACASCFKAMMQSMSLDEMILKIDQEHTNFLDLVLQHQTKLKGFTVEYKNPLTIDVTSTNPWTRMYRLRFLELFIPDVTLIGMDWKEFMLSMSGCKYLRHFIPNNSSEAGDPYDVAAGIRLFYLRHHKTMKTIVRNGPYFVDDD